MKAYSIFIFLVCFLLPMKWAIADIELGNVWGNASFNSLEVRLGISSDEDFNYEVAICGLNNGNANLNTPIPETWNEVLIDKCFNNECQTGFWSRFAEDGHNSNFFSWSEISDASCIILVFSNVDTESPIIDYECANGIGSTAIAPSITTDANSAIVRTFMIEECAQAHLIGDLGFFFSNQCGDFDFSFLGPIYTQSEAGVTGAETYSDNFGEAQWQACTLAIRMQSIPTLSQLDPSEAGTQNTFSANGATPGGDVTFIWGFVEQTVAADNICPGLQAGIFNPRVLRNVTADGAGTATFNVNIPANFAGISVVLQAIDLTSCTGSNVNNETITEPQGQEPPVLLAMNPGQAGQQNTLSATGATPNNNVRFIWSFNTGNQTANNICQGFQSGVANPRTLPIVQSDGTGTASLNVNVPANLAGISVVLQAVDLATCTGSNVNPETL